MNDSLPCEHWDDDIDVTSPPCLCPKDCACRVEGCCVGLAARRHLMGHDLWRWKQVQTSRYAFEILRTASRRMEHDKRVGRAPSMISALAVASDGLREDELALSGKEEAFMILTGRRTGDLVAAEALVQTLDDESSYHEKLCLLDRAAFCARESGEILAQEARFAAPFLEPTVSWQEPRHNDLPPPPPPKKGREILG